MAVIIRSERIRWPCTKLTFGLYEELKSADREADNSFIGHYFDSERFLVMAGKLLSEAKDCLMGTNGCSEAISVWTLGMAGECFNPQAGFRIGKGGFTLVSLQVNLLPASERPRLLRFQSFPREMFVFLENSYVFMDTVVLCG